LLMMADGRKFWVPFGLGLALVMIYGPIVGPPDHNGLRYLIAPLICPWIPAAYYLLRPIRPYSGYRGRWGTLGGMVGKDKTDPEAARLTALFASPEARNYIRRVALRMSAILFAPLVITALFASESLTWTPLSLWQFQGFTVGLIGSSIALFADVIDWGIRAWAKNARPTTA
jgi:hypothetical protein